MKKQGKWRIENNNYGTSFNTGKLFQVETDSHPWLAYPPGAKGGKRFKTQKKAMKYVSKQLSKGAK